MDFAFTPEQEALREPQHVERAEHHARHGAGAQDERQPGALLVLMPGSIERAEQHQELAGETARRREPDGGEGEDHEEHGVQGQQLRKAAVCSELPRVAALVYIAAFAPDADETTQRLQEKFPATDIFSHIEVADGRVWLKPDGVSAFAGDLSDQEQKLIWATHAAPTADLFNQKVEGTAWKSKPSWYIVATSDRTIQPDLERFVAKRMGAKVFETDSSHVPMLSQPDLVLDVIRKAATAVQKAHG